MRTLVWLLRIMLFLLLLGFAVKNSDPVIVQYYFGQEWRAPLVFVLLVTLCAGVVLGIIASLGQIFKQRREIAELKRERRAAARVAQSRVPPAADPS
jgi:uncharacterized integral membrane protein